MHVFETDPYQALRKRAIGLRLRIVLQLCSAGIMRQRLSSLRRICG